MRQRYIFESLGHDPAHPAKPFFGVYRENYPEPCPQPLCASDSGGGSQILLALEELGGCIPDHRTPALIVEEKELGKVINQFLGTLLPEARRIFLQRYWSLMSVKDIAQLYGITESKVKMSLMRTRSKFKHYLEKEGGAV